MAPGSATLRSATKYLVLARSNVRGAHWWTFGHRGAGCAQRSFTTGSMEARVRHTLVIVLTILVVGCSESADSNVELVAWTIGAEPAVLIGAPD